jgi:hypothetical protein
VRSGCGRCGGWGQPTVTLPLLGAFFLRELDERLERAGFSAFWWRNFKL